MFVSVSAYNDGGLLAGCLKSINEVLPDASVQVVDGRYETWPEGDDNSTDNTRRVAAWYDAEYVPGGPYERERDKHIDRVRRAPDGRRAVFLDADERLLQADLSRLEDGVAYQPRIVNALVYGPRAVYWPRSFYPETVEGINRWDAYQFSTPCKRSDAVTIVHRHDLRDRGYREAKYERFRNEDRAGRYEDDFETYLEDDWNATFETCPACGRESVTACQLTDYGPRLSQVEVCTAGDRCHSRVVAYDSGDWKYLPDDYLTGFQEDPGQLRAELMDAGCEYVFRDHSVGQFRQLEGIVARWIETHLRDGKPPLYEDGEAEGVVG